jgi:glycosyltransferase involved in cell wall biosynthesis
MKSMPGHAMKVLYFAPHTCWPLHTGARLRDYHLARELARRAEVTFVGLRDPGDPDPGEPPAAAGFARYAPLVKDRSYTPWKIARGLIGPLPLTVLNYFSPRAAAELAGILDQGNFDIVQVESVHLLPYLPVIRAARSHPAVAADWHNIESELMWRYSEAAPDPARRWVARRTASLIERAELEMLRSCDVHLTASERERERLASRLPQAELHVIPNGVDCGAFTAPCIDPRGDPEIIFVGSMDYHANIDAVQWFAREIWPDLSHDHPRLRLTVVGRNPTPAIRALASESIEITGTVSDVRPYYSRALALVVPLRIGSGTRLKILEALAAGVPVLSTRLGAEGLEVADGITIMLADTPEQFRNCFLRLEASPDLRMKLIQAGRELVSERYDWPILGTRLSQIHSTLVTRVMQGRVLS